MFEANQTQALQRLLQLFAEGGRHERQSLIRLEPSVRTFLSDSLDGSSRLMGGGADVVKAHATLTVVMRAIWNLVPPQLFSAMSPDFQALSERAIQKNFPAHSGGEQVAQYLAVIFKRIRRFARPGRQAASLDMEKLNHREIFDAQAGRCNHCLYEFVADTYRYASEEDGVPADPEPFVEGEIRAEIFARKPELDHIIPLVLGGDSPENWQILCASCNRGKSDLVSYFYGVAGVRSSRMSDLFELHSGKRYAVIAEVRGAEAVECQPRDAKCYRVFKRSPDGFLNPVNLVARYC